MSTTLQLEPHAGAPSRNLKKKAMDEMRQMHESEFALGVATARWVWRHCRELVEGPKLPDWLAAHLRETGDPLPDQIAPGGTEILDAAAFEKPMAPLGSEGCRGAGYMPEKHA